ncbi:MAG: aldehyde dehydrogenase family protein [Deltaproteobacteria bacterium]|nr:aldehyde dehydrogenase family protein [Candidatus Zymogenaceae bacterium]
MSHTSARKTVDEDKSKEFVVSKSPATGQKLGVSQLNTPDDVLIAVETAKKIQPLWAATPIKERSRAMIRVRDYIVQHADEIAQTVSLDNGKTLTDAMVAEAFGAALAADYYAKNTKRLIKDKGIRPGLMMMAYKKSKIIRVPYGVIGIISPWNYPFTIPFVEIVMALMAGNAVVLKVATETQQVGRELEKCFNSVGLPEGLFTHVNLPGRIAGDAFLSAGIDKLFFTGSVGVGKQLMALASRTLTPLSLELGGNDPMLVCPDANLYRAATGAVWAGLSNSGQTCAAVERIYVHKDVYDSFMDLLGKQVESIRVGKDGFNVDIGAMTTTQQMETVKQHITDALDKGAVIAAQSAYPKDSGGNFLPATILANVDHSMVVMREETFGPVLGVMKVDDMEQAVALANDSNLGLTASVWSRNRRYAESLARRIQSGVVMINDHLMSNGLAETPWGGFKESGIGRTHGELGMMEMTQPICIVHDYLPGVQRNMWWYPAGKEIYDGIKGMMDFLFSHNIGKRMSGGIRLTRLFMRSFTKERH